MARINTDEFLSKVSKGDFSAIKLKAIQSGSYILLLESADGVFIHENRDGTLKEYPKADHAIIWLKRMTKVNEFALDITLWRGAELLSI